MMESLGAVWCVHRTSYLLHVQASFDREGDSDTRPDTCMHLHFACCICRGYARCNCACLVVRVAITIPGTDNQ